LAIQTVAPPQPPKGLVHGDYLVEWGGAVDGEELSNMAS